MTAARDDDLDVLEAYRAMTPAQKEAVIDQASPELLDLLMAEERRAAIHRSPLDMALLYETKWRRYPHLEYLNQILVDIAEGRLPRVIICIPPRHGKTELAVRWMCAWYLTRYPDRRVMVTSHSGNLAKKAGRWVRNLINGTPELPIDVADDSAAAEMWDVKGRSGGMVAVGIDGTITGIGTNLFILDDPYSSRAQAESDATRSHVQEFFTDTALARLETPSAVIVIMQRWHVNDLVGWLERTYGDLWTVINLPAIAEEDDPLGRAPGEPLWPERIVVQEDGTEIVEPHYDTAWAELKRLEQGEYAWNSQQQQRPAPRDGGLWKGDWIEQTRVTPEQVPAEFDEVALTVDPAGTSKKTSDLTGMVVQGRTGDRLDGDVYLLADLSDRYPSEQWPREALLAAHRFGASTIVYESNYGGDNSPTMLNSAYKDLVREKLLPGDWLMPLVKEAHAGKGQSKTVRAEPIAQQYSQRRHHHAGTFAQLEHQLLTFNGTGKSPDRMDALVWGATFLTTEPTAEKPVGYIGSIGKPRSRAVRCRGDDDDDW